MRTPIQDRLLWPQGVLIIAMDVLLYTLLLAMVEVK